MPEPRAGQGIIRNPPAAGERSRPHGEAPGIAAKQPPGTDSEDHHLTGSAPRPRQRRPEPRESCLPQLLQAYDTLISSVSSLPPLLMVPSSQQLPMPRPRWFLRYFLVQHVDRTTEALSRRYSARAALGRAGPQEQADRAAVADFRDSLPPRRTALYRTLLALEMVIVGHFAIRWAIRFFSSLSEPDATVLNPAGRDNAGKLLNQLGDALQPSGIGVSNLADGLFSSTPTDLLLIALGLALALYLVLRPVMPAFRLKRMLLNCYPNLPRNRRLVTAAWHVQHATGVYELERTVFQELGTRPPQEAPVDLLVPLLIQAWVIGLAVAAVKVALLTRIPDARFGAILVGVPTAVIAVSRVGWLARTYRRRIRGGQENYPPFVVRIGVGDALAVARSPLSIVAWLLPAYAFFVAGAVPTRSVGILLITLWFAYGLEVLCMFPWWYERNRELRDLLEPHAPGIKGDPRWSAAAFVLALLVIPPGVSVYRAQRRIERYEQPARVVKRIARRWLYVASLLVFPLGLALLQRRLNLLWARVATPIPGIPPLTWSARNRHRSADRPDITEAADQPVRAHST